MHKLPMHATKCLNLSDTMLRKKRADTVQTQCTSISERGNTNQMVRRVLLLRVESGHRLGRRNRKTSKVLEVYIS